MNFLKILFFKFIKLNYFVYVCLFIAGCENDEQKSIKADKITREYLSTTNLPGLSISVAKKGKIVFSRGYGYADVEQKKKIDPSKTKFRIGSVSKTYAATALGILSERKILDLEEDIYKYVSSFPSKKWKFNTMQLAGHLSGIRHYKNDEMLINEDFESVYDAMEFFKYDTLLHKPGTKYHYSTHAWTLISLIIENTSKSEFLSFMNTEVFAPLKMNDTQAELQAVDNDLVKFYQFNSSRDTFEIAPKVNNSWKWAGGGFVSTTEDVIRFLNAHTKPGFFKKNTLELLTTSQFTADGEKTNYGIGWRIREGRNGDILYGHTGGSVGGTTYAFWNKRTDTIVVITSNIGRARFGELPLDIFDVYRN